MENAGTAGLAEVDLQAAEAAVQTVRRLGLLLEPQTALFVLLLALGTVLVELGLEDAAPSQDAATVLRRGITH